MSGAHLNPVVSLVDASFGHIGWRDAWAYSGAQTVGCVIGCVVANLMFAKAVVTFSTHHRASGAHLLAEVVATSGLVALIFMLAKTDRGHLAPAAVGAYIGAAYFFTSSSSFANPAIVIGRMFTNTFAGIAPSSGPAFIGAEVVGGLLGLGLVRVLVDSKAAYRLSTPTAEEVS